MASINIPMATNEQQIRAIKVRQKYNDQADAIRLNGNLSRQGKADALGTLYIETLSQLGELKQDEQDTAATALDALRQKVLGLTKLEAQSDSAAISYRDATDRAARLTDEDAALALLETVNISRDTILARCILATAMTKRWARVVDEYEELNPSVAADVDALWQRTDANDARIERISRSMTYSIMRPSEISGISDIALRGRL